MLMLTLISVLSEAANHVQPRQGKQLITHITWGSKDTRTKFFPTVEILSPRLQTAPPFTRYVLRMRQCMKVQATVKGSEGWEQTSLTLRNVHSVVLSSALTYCTVYRRIIVLRPSRGLVASPSPVFPPHATYPRHPTPSTMSISPDLGFLEIHKMRNDG
ncbi:hypothetical protein BJ875DRAFT_457362 [Amylocarpus encephaloides]|uniref:Secreted protein n=1 Tax=Amylocarpus encephaloides TaxID=45428 RepID=A0A9P7YN50_9HELO|nr:hypothetical protein BJ875DRAFT_457362 [Amylocarpus encephaloides]